MKERRRFVALIMVGALAVSTVGVAPPAEAKGRWFEKKAENKVMRKINRKRSNIGKNTLQTHWLLRRLGRQHSKYDSQTQGSISHNCVSKTSGWPCPGNHPHSPKTRWTIMQQRGFTTFCENVAANFSGRAKGNWKQAARTFYKQWLNSTAGHKECMLSRLGWRGTKAGVGIHKRGGWWYATLLVARK